MIKKIIFIPAILGLSLFIKYAVVLINLIFKWQTSISFVGQHHNAEKVVSPYNVLIFSIAFCIVALLYFIDWKTNKGKEGNQTPSWGKEL